MEKEKPTIHSAALVIYNKDKSKYLIVKRPSGDDSMSDYWGFPAATKKNINESWEDVVKRAAKIKLGVDIKIVRNLGEDKIDRGKYILILRDYEVKIISGEPSVPQPFVGVTQYVEKKWTDDPTNLKESAKKGSLCSRVFLRTNNIDW